MRSDRGDDPLAVGIYLEGNTASGPGALRAGASDADFDPPLLDRGSQLSLRIRRAAMPAVLTDAQLATVLLPLVAGPIASPGHKPVCSHDQVPASTLEIRWSPAGDWITVDYRTGEHGVSLAKNWAATSLVPRGFSSGRGR